MGIIVDNIKFGYKNNDLLFENLSMDIVENKINAIIGPIGCGKSTLLKIIKYDFPINFGKVKNDFRAECILYLSFNSSLDNYESVLEVFVDYFGVSKCNYQDILKNINCDDVVLNKKINELTSFQKKKILFSKVYAKNIKLLLCDDFFSGISESDKLFFSMRIKNLKKEMGKTIIICSDDSDFLLTIVDFIFVLNLGKIVATGSKYQIYGDKKLLNDNNIVQPKLLKFSDIVFERKNIKMGYRDDISDLMKDVYRYVK